MRIAPPAFCGRMFFVRFDFIYLYGVVVAHIDTFAAIIANFCRVEVAKHTFAAINAISIINFTLFSHKFLQILKQMFDKPLFI